MIIKNLIKKPLTLKLKRLAGEGEEYDIEVSPEGITDIEHSSIILGLDELKRSKKLAVVGELPLEETVVADVVATIEPLDETTPEAPQPSKDDFICDVCGECFASQKGLNTHKRRAHTETNN